MPDPHTCPICGVPLKKDGAIRLHFWHAHSGWPPACFCGWLPIVEEDLDEHWRERGGIHAHLIAHGLGIDDTPIPF